MTVRLKIQNLFKVFSDQPAAALSMLQDGKTKADVLAQLNQVVGLDDVSLNVEAGAIYTIMGMSGSGKSTLARCINRLNQPSAGKILLDGEDICALNDEALREVRRTRISMVFQHFALLPNRSVIDNVEFGLKLRGTPAKQRRARAEEVLDVVGLSRWAARLPSELSGGMRQRVGLARALATEADVLIMDEAFSALDPLIRSEMQNELLRLQATLKKTIVFITHDFQEALKLGTRIAIMADGRLVREGSPQSIVLDPGSDYVDAFTRDVDRARLFDAGSVMKTLAPIMHWVDGTVMGDPVRQDALVFLLNHDQRVIACLLPEGLDQLRLGASPIRGEFTGSHPFTTTSFNAKLVDVARRFRSGVAMAVIDDDGRFVGTLDAEHILRRVGQGSVAGSEPAAARIDAYRKMTATGAQHHA